jgi:hypothetical protein
VGTDCYIHISYSRPVKAGTGPNSQEQYIRSRKYHRKSSSPNCGKLGSPSTFGAVAQLGERRLCTAEVRGSNPLGSTLEMWGFAAKT